MALKDCVELVAFMDKLKEEGFNRSEDNSLVYQLFDEDSDSLDHDNLSWREAKELFKTLSHEAKFERIDGEYGGEGEGEYCYGVIRLGDKYYKAEWSYYSFNGCDWDYICDTVREVFPVEKAITVYE